MVSPFPGMDPYLEAYWGDVHTSLCTYARDQLRPQLPRELRVRVEEYVAVGSDAGPEGGFYPDVQVTQPPRDSSGPGETAAAGVAAEPLIVPMQTEPETLREVHILDRSRGDRLVTAIEFLSPSNKRHAAGRAAYVKKQQAFLEGGVNLVEIDLLRSGPYVLAVPVQNVPDDYLAPYRICVVRAAHAERAEVYRVSLRELLPAIRIPLRENDPDAYLPLQNLIDQAYENGQYDDIDYAADPAPPLSPSDAEWADTLLKEQGRRESPTREEG